MAKCTHRTKDRSGNKPIAYLYEGSKILVLPCFVYEVDVYKTWSNGFSLVKSRTFKSNKFLKLKNYVTTKQYDGYKLERSIELIGAPMSFIKKRGLSKDSVKVKRNAKK